MDLHSRYKRTDLLSNRATTSVTCDMLHLCSSRYCYSIPKSAQLVSSSGCSLTKPKGWVEILSFYNLSNRSPTQNKQTYNWVSTWFLGCGLFSNHKCLSGPKTLRSEHPQAVFAIVMLKKTGTAPLAGAAGMDVHVTAAAQPCWSAR